jgi:hypothetical protein
MLIGLLHDGRTAELLTCGSCMPFHCLEQSDNKSKNYAVVDSGRQRATLWHAGLISCKKFIAVINFQRGHGASV